MTCFLKNKDYSQQEEYVLSVSMNVMGSNGCTHKKD